MELVLVATPDQTVSTDGIDDLGAILVGVGVDRGHVRVETASILAVVDPVQQRSGRSGWESAVWVHPLVVSGNEYPALVPCSAGAAMYTVTCSGDHGSRSAGNRRRRAAVVPAIGGVVEEDLPIGMGEIADGLGSVGSGGLRLRWDGGPDRGLWSRVGLRRLRRILEVSSMVVFDLQEDFIRQRFSRTKRFVVAIIEGGPRLDRTASPEDGSGPCGHHRSTTGG